MCVQDLLSDLDKLYAQDGTVGGRGDVGVLEARYCVVGADAKQGWIRPACTILRLEAKYTIICKFSPCGSWSL